MNKIIVTLFILFIALVGASSVAACDADNSSTLELDDSHDNAIIIIDVEPNTQTEDNNPGVEPKTQTNGHYEGSIPIRDNTAIENCSYIQNHECNKESAIFIRDNTAIENCTFIQNGKIENYEDMIKSDRSKYENGYANYNKIMNFFNKQDHGNINDSERVSIIELYDEIVDTYDAGQATLIVAYDYGMNVNMIKDIVETYYKPNQNKIINYVLEEYGSSTIKSIAANLEISKDTVNAIVKNVKNGAYGETYKKIFLRRDLILHNNSELVNAVLEEYGSANLNTIAANIGQSNETIYKTIKDLKNGAYGETYKQILFKHDQSSSYRQDYDYIIN